MLKKIVLFSIIFILNIGAIFAAGNIVPLSSFTDPGAQQAIVELHNNNPNAGILVGGEVNSANLANAQAGGGAANGGEGDSGGQGGGCRYDGEGDILTALEGGCISDTALVQKDDLKVVTGLKTVLIEWIKKIAGFLALGAIFSIAYGSLMLTLSMGEDDKIKKAKDIIKWGILGFLGVVSAGFLIAMVVNLMYFVGG